MGYEVVGKGDARILSGDGERAVTGDRWPDQVPGRLEE